MVKSQRLLSLIAQSPPPELTYRFEILYLIHVNGKEHQHLKSISGNSV